MDPDRLAELGSCRLGVWTRAEARAAGTSRSSTARLVRQQEWQRAGRRALADGGYVLDARMRAAAAVADVGDDAVVAGRTAARWWGIPLIDDDDPATHRHEASLDDVICRRRVGAVTGLTPHRWALAADEVVTVDGLSITTPLRTLRDLSVLLRLDALLCACDAALRARQVTTPGIVAAAARLRGRPGGPALAWCAAWVDGRAESPLETLTRIALWSPSLPEFAPQLRVHDQQGHVMARLDHGVALLRLGIESDGAGPHSLPKARFADRHREARLKGRGYDLVRVTWPDARLRRDDVRARAAAAVRSQTRRHGVTAPPSSARPAPPPEIWR